MGYRELFLEYVNGNLSFSAAAAKLAREAGVQNTNPVEARKAGICASYFTHYDWYNHGGISRNDFLMFLRDFILYLGRSPMPKLVEQIVRESGSAFGLSVAPDGCVDAAFDLPEWLENQKFVREVYALAPYHRADAPVIPGDRVISENSIFQTYRSIEQKIAVHAAIELPDDHTMLASLPTGGGKSLITQMLAVAGSGLTVVVVPTVALAMDQFIQARRCIAAPGFCSHIFCYHSDAAPLDVKKMLSEIHTGAARLLIVSPEGIMKNMALNQAIRLAAEKKYLRNVVIDEAHIVPDWGILFRPDFQIFSVLLKELRRASQYTVRTYLLSATLSDEVVDTLLMLFGQEGKNVQYRCDTLRSEPRFLYSECHDFAQRRSRVIELVQCLPKPLILYVLEPKEAEYYKKQLEEKNFQNIQTFTGETKDRQRKELLEKWKNDQIDVMIGTSAFGMGVDKDNVRTVIHACVPENISRFYQEVGRAGRDGFPSLSVMMPYVGKSGHKSDLDASFGMVSKSILGVDKLIVRWFSLIRDPRTVITGQEVMADLNTVPSNFSEEDAAHTGIRNMTWNVNALMLLHRQQYIRIEAARYVPEQNTYCFTFQMLDTDVLWDEAALRAAVAPDRNQEQSVRLDGYHQIAALVHRPKSRCWGKRLVKLFPLAEELCSGCPVHPVRPQSYDDAVKIREEFPIDFEPAEPEPILKRYLGTYSDVIIPTEDHRSIDRNQLVCCMDRLKLSCLVLPDTEGITVIPDAMVLSIDEFIVTAQRAPWLFRKGIMLLYGDNAGRNNKLFEVTHSGSFKKITKVMLCREDMMIDSQMRPLNEFLEYNQTTLTYL